MKLRTTFSLLFVFFTTFSLFAQWQQTEGPEGGETYSIKLIDGVLWAGTHGGLYQSWDDGVTWQRNESFAPEWSVTTVEVIDDEIFLTIIRVDEGFEDFLVELYRSTDGGNTWDIQEMDNFFFYFDVEAAEIFKINDRLFFSFDNRLMRSDDNGQSWIDLYNNFPTYISEFGYDDNKLVAADYQQLFISNDYGDTWEFIDSVGTQADILFEDDFIMIPSYDTMFVSTDLGETWSQYPLPYDYFNGDLRRSENGKLYAVDSRMYVSENNGMTWDTINTEYLGGINDFLETDDGEFIITNYRGIFLTSNQGAAWHPSNAGLKANNVYSIFAAPSGEVFTRTNVGNFRSPNGGLNWFKWHLPGPYVSIRRMLWQGDTALIAADGGVFRSTDNLVTYDTISPTYFGYSVGLFSTYEDKIYLTSEYNDTIYVTSDKGDSWQNILGPDIQFGDYNHLEIVNGIFLLVSGNGEIYRSEDNGETWTLVLEFWAPGVTYHRLYQIGNRVILSDGDGWFYSIDDGLTWTEFAPTGMPILDQFDDAPEPSQMLPIGNLLFATHRFHGVYVSSDFGDSWQPTNVGLGNLRSRSLTNSNNAMYLGTTQGSIWSRGANFQGANGQVFHDQNGNGIKDAGDLPMSNIIVEAKPLNSYASTYTDGTYTLYADALNDTIRAISPSPYATVSPDYYLSSGTTTSNDFGIYFIPGIDDLCITASVVEPIRPGFESSLVLTVKNIGTTNLSPEVKFVLPDGIDLVAASPVNTSMNGDTVIWQLPELMMFECQNITINIYANANLMLGSELTFLGYVLPDGNDQHPVNNSFELTETVIGAYDPNDKKVSPAYLTPEELAMGERLTYTIRFQNTGTYHAENVRIVDTLSNHLDLSTLQIIAASHEPMDWHIRGERVLEFVFENILLPDSTANEPESHGFVQFSIQPNSDLQLGDEIANTGHIYFDFNEAIVTNTAVAPISDVSSTVNIQAAAILNISPNPNQGEFQLNLSENITGEGRLQIYGIDGQLQYANRIFVENGQVTSSQLNFPAGQYIVRLLINGKRFVKKMVVIE